MVSDKKLTGRASSMPAGLAVGLLVAVAVTMLGVAAVATLVLSGHIPEGSVGYFAMVIIGASVIFGAFVAVHRLKRRRLFVSAAVGAVYLLTLWGISMIFFGGVQQGIVPTVIIVSCCSCGVGICGVRVGDKGRSAVKKYRPR